MSTPSCATSALPVSLSPSTTFRTPLGRISAAISASLAVVTGVVGAGLRTTVLPVASAAATIPVGIAIGKFHGEMTAAIPRGT
jgi:hypothetical protein